MNATNYTCSRCGETHPVQREQHFGNYGKDDQGRMFCLLCCARHDAEQMLESDSIVLYVNSEGTHVTNWPNTLRMPATVRPCGGMFRGYSRRVKAVSVSTIGPDGSRWFGRGPGKGMYVRLRKSKAKAR